MRSLWPQGARENSVSFFRLSASSSRGRKGFVFGQHNAVRQWLCLRYPDTRQTRTGNVGLVLERGGEIVWNSAIAMAWLRRASIEAQANFGCDHGKAVLCSDIHQRAFKGETR